MLPHAALRLKQGFGRLIRATTDRGAVVLLDGRVLEKSYGRYFLDSLPPAPVETGRWPELRRGLEAFYARHSPSPAAPAAPAAPDAAAGVAPVGGRRTAPSQSKRSEATSRVEVALRDSQETE